MIMEEILDKKVVLSMDIEEVESLEEQAIEFIENINSFRTLCKRYNIPDDDLEEIYETLNNDNLVESIRQEQLEKHPLFGQVEFDTLKLTEKIANDLQDLESFQKRITTSYSSRKFILEKSGKLEIDLKAIKDSCSVFGSEKAKIALDKISKASELINDIRGKTHHTDQLHNFTNLFTANSGGQIIPNLKFIRGL